ncbi:MAG: PP2C family protein-serine/threonine phosphatase [Blastocatellia bacterium]
MASKPASAQLSVGAKSHTGIVRTENQDRMGRFLSPFGELFIVADGMGGHQGGALAAAMLTDGFENYLRQLPPTLSAKAALQQVAQQINSEIYQRANSGDPTTAKMGSTLVLALVKSGQLLIGHAGDSRAYLVRQNRLTRLTKDHSAVQKMIDYNMLTEAEARDHPDASVINRAFGQAPEIELEVSEPLPIAPGDGLLLCSDGLCGYVDDSEVANVIGRYDDAGKIADALVELALNAGGEDNVTVQFLQFGTRSASAFGRPLEAQMLSGDQLIPITQSGNYSKKPTGNVLTGMSLPMKYALVAVVVMAIFVLGTFLGSKFDWLWGGVSPTPTPAASPSPYVSPSPQRSPESGGDTQPGPSLEPSKVPTAPSVLPPTPTPKQTPTPAPRSGQSGANPTLPRTPEELAKDVEQKAKELRDQVTKPLDQKPAEQPSNTTTPPSSGQQSGSSDKKPTDGKASDNAAGTVKAKKGGAVPTKPKPAATPKKTPPVTRDQQRKDANKKDPK